jgi:diguanylate cyclase (GGDEF)-like protein
MGQNLLLQLEQFLEHENHNPQSIDPVMRSMIGAGEELVMAVQKDDLLSKSMQQLVGQLEIPFIQEAISDPKILENPDHPVRRFLEALQGLSRFCTTQGDDRFSGGGSPMGLEQVTREIQQGNLLDIREATRQIEGIKERQKGEFERNRDLAVKSCEHSERLRRARREVKESLRDLLLGQSISLALKRLFDFGWTELLIHTMILKKRESPEWKAYFRVVEILLKLFRPNKSSKPLPEKQTKDLMKIISKGFRQYPVHPKESVKFAAELDSALQEGGEGQQIFLDERIEVDEAYLKGLFLGQPGYEDSEEEETEVDRKWLELVRGIDLDEWIVEHLGQDQIRLLNLAWRDAESRRCLLVDGNGIKVGEYSESALVGKFQAQEYGLLEGRELNIVDRAMQRILKNTYNSIQNEVSYDELTGLMNRRAFERRLNELLVEITDQGRVHTLILLDVDQFGLVNDICGFEGGDKLLQLLPKILHSYLPDDAQLARTGDDEFVVLLPDFNLEQAFLMAEAQRQAVDEQQFSWNNKQVRVSVSLGMVAIDSRDFTSVELLHAAASACAIAKKEGRNCIRVYSESDEAFQQRNRLIESASVIESALEQNRMTLVGQLISPLQDEEVAAHYEVLLRVLDEDGEMKNPYQFIIAAEEYNLMLMVDTWVVKSFFSQVEKFGDSLDRIGGFSINLSGQSVSDSGFRDFLMQQIADSPIPAHKLGFEITETVMVKSKQETKEFIRQIRELGCPFYLDDFGSGYASYSYLKDLPVSHVKIDGIFIKDLLVDHASHTMVKSVTEIAHFMNKKVVAEFVENQETVDALKKIGVDYFQGYHIGMPIPFGQLFSEGRLADTA